MVWKGLPGIDAIRPLDASDQSVVDAVREVLVQHGALERFGLTLLHSHFDLEPGEVLVEQVDANARILTTRAMHLRTETRPGALQATSFRLDAAGGTPMTVTYCWRPPNSTFHATDANNHEEDT